MKRSKKRDVSSQAEVANNFMRGFVASGLLVSLQASRRHTVAPLSGKKILQHALQGGIAIAAGVASANTIQQRQYGQALLAIATGAAGIVAVEYLMDSPPIAKKDQAHEQEKV